MKISCTSCKVTTKNFQTLFLVTILASLGNSWVSSTPQPKCTPYTGCIENHYVIYKSPLTVQSESRSNVEFYHLYNNSLSLKDQISYRLKWKTFQLGGNFPECENDSVTVFVGNGSNLKQVGTFCGRTIPHDIYSLDGCFTLQLKNGRTYQSKFEAEVEFIPYSKSDSLCENLSISTESHGVILSPGWPTIPKSRSSCTWSIKANANQYIVLNFMDVVLGGSSTIEIGTDPQKFTFKISKENVKNITTYMTYNREVEIKYTPDNITGEGASNRFALGWMLVDKAPKSSQNKKSSSRGFPVIAICFLSLFGIFFLFACFGCRPKRRLQRVVSNRLPSSLHLSQTIQVSFDNEASNTTEERSVSTRNQEENTTSRTRSNFTNEIDIGSRRDSFNNLLHLLEMAVLGNTARDEIGIDNNTLEMAEPPEGNIESNSEIGNYNSVFNDPSDSPPTYNDVTLGPSPPSEAPPPSYDEVLNMAR